MPDGAALALADHRLQKDWLGREEMVISLPTRYLDITAGDVLVLSDEPDRKWLVGQVETGAVQTLTLSSLEDVPKRTFAGEAEKWPGFPLVRCWEHPPQYLWTCLCYPAAIRADC